MIKTKYTSHYLEERLLKVSKLKKYIYQSAYNFQTVYSRNDLNQYKRIIFSLFSFQKPPVKSALLSRQGVLRVKLDLSPHYANNFFLNCLYNSIGLQIFINHIANQQLFFNKCTYSLPFSLTKSGMMAINLILSTKLLLKIK